MDLMFSGCSSLISFDLTEFNIKGWGVFNDCLSLEEIKLGNSRAWFEMPEGRFNGTDAWHSAAENKNFSNDEIENMRLGIPDTYTKPQTSLTNSTVSIRLEGAWNEGKWLYTGSEVRPYVRVSVDGCEIGEKNHEFAPGGEITELKKVNYTVSYKNNIEPGIATIEVTGQNGFKDSRTIEFEIYKHNIYPVPTPDNPDTSDPKPDEPGTADPEPVGTQAMYRLYNPNSGEHFYTSSPVERQAVIDAGWNDEGVGWTAPTEGIKVYRLYNSFAGEHHYTTSEAERDMLVSVGWTWEEGGWFSDPNESVPLYRAYNPNAYANNHHYTLDWGEFQTLLGLGWQDEGVGWHGVK